MITPRTEPSKFWSDQPEADLVIQEHFEAKLSIYIAKLSVMGELNRRAPKRAFAGLGKG